MTARLFMPNAERQRALAIWLSGFALVVFVVLLLGNNLLAQMELERSASDQLVLDTRKRADALEYLFAERVSDIRELGAAREVAAYFTNKALGMSMKYGLRANLLAIRSRFAEVIERHRLRGEPLFKRILLTDARGERLVEVGSEDAPRNPVPEWVKDLPRTGPNPEIRLVAGTRGIVVSLPYYFKDRFEGHIVAWISAGAVQRNFLHTAAGFRGRHDTLVTNDGMRVFVADARSRSVLSGLGPLDEMREEVVNRIQLEGEDGAQLPMAAIKLAVAGTPFSVVSTLPLGEALGSRGRGNLLFISVSLPVVILAALVIVMRFRRLNSSLRTKYVESERQQGELQEKYEELEGEVARRQRVEQELRTKKQQVEERTQELQSAIKEAHVLAFYDGLTGLANRLLFRDRIQQALASARRQNQMVALLFLDLDRFKRINDTLGHHIGDHLLKRAARRLERCARGSDSVVRPDGEQDERCVSRQGGDEFTILLTDIHAPHDAAKVARRVLDSLAKPMNLEGYEVSISTSVGISMFPADGADAETLMKNADIAMYSAKEGGGNGYRFYEHAMNAQALARLALEADMRKGFERGEFMLYYQPKIETVTGRIVGAEALVRWQHPEKGLVSPGDFIPVAEESGFIVPLTEWVLHTACVQCKVWEEICDEAITVSVNLSGRHFRQQNIFEMVSTVLREVDLEPRRLEVEITESVLMENRDEARTVLEQLKEMGVHISIDDFGTGYSSLSYLKSFPIDTLKVDRSFVRDIPGDPNDTVLVRAIVAMAQSLGLRVVAEGVETRAQYDFLRSLMCDEVQGYLISPPLPEGEFLGMLPGEEHNERNVSALF